MSTSPSPAPGPQGPDRPRPSPATGRTVLGRARARADGRLRPKATLRDPATRPDEPAGLLTLVHQAHAEGPR